jgi:hypothetical protein
MATEITNLYVLRYTIATVLITIHIDIFYYYFYLYRIVKVNFKRSFEYVKLTPT